MFIRFFILLSVFVFHTSINQGFCSDSSKNQAKLLSLVGGSDGENEGESTNKGQQYLRPIKGTRSTSLSVSVNGINSHHALNNKLQGGDLLDLEKVEYAFVDDEYMQIRIVKRKYGQFLKNMYFFQSPEELLECLDQMPNLTVIVSDFNMSCDDLHGGQLSEKVAASGNICFILRSSEPEDKLLQYSKTSHGIISKLSTNNECEIFKTIIKTYNKDSEEDIF